VRRKTRNRLDGFNDLETTRAALERIARAIHAPAQNESRMAHSILRRAVGASPRRRDAGTLGGLLRQLRAFGLRVLRGAALQALGFSIICVGFLLTLALVTWSPLDPSFNMATEAPVTNALGQFGAYFADAVLQLIGLAAIAFLMPPVIWGLRLLTLVPEDRWTLRLILWPVAILAMASVCAHLPAPPSLTGGLGGVLGGLLRSGLMAIFGGEGGWANLVSLIVSFLALAIAGPLSCGMRFTHLERAFEWIDYLYREIADRIAPLLPQRVYVEDEIAQEQPRARGGIVPERLVPEAASRQKRERRVERAAKPKPGKRAAKEAQPVLKLVDEAGYQLPPLSLLAKPKVSIEPQRESDEALEQNARLLESVLSDFGVRGAITSVRPGPVVTLYELEPAAGIKASRVISLADDIARSMSAVSARVAVVPGRNVIGIELPNRRREMVLLRELLSSPEYESAGLDLTLVLGKDIGGAAVMADLARMPHLLIAGTTGSGKSVAINTMILSLLYRLTPSQCRMILIDPKMLELSVYDEIPHLLSPVVTEPKKAIAALKWTVREMEDRYRKMSKLGVRNIAGYNDRVLKARDKGETLQRRVQTGFDRETGEPIYETEIMDLGPLPFIVVVVDEMADLMIVAGKEIEGLVQRLAQMARAAGIHLITATQRPSVDVITGTIKANFPTRVSFQVTSKIDSRTILGEQGAEQLLGQGDMLYMAGGGRIRRVHGPFVSDAEVEDVVKHLKAQGRPEYLEAVTAEPDEEIDPMSLVGGDGDGDDLYRQAVEIVVRDRKATTSYIQRRLQIGYNRAARIIERMEEEGVLSTPNHMGKREILIDERG
jgi:DNA segregation ATPase FtsK/SpoIIIE, S-DNA-T family